MPLAYNDGTEIEDEKHLQTRNELLARFGGCRLTTNSHAAYEGLWEHSGHVYRDLVKSLIVEAVPRASEYSWLSSYKRELEYRFAQIQIYIAVREIKRIV